LTGSLVKVSELTFMLFSLCFIVCF
jgi:hypothetical protein